MSQKDVSVVRGLGILGGGWMGWRVGVISGVGVRYGGGKMTGCCGIAGLSLGSNNSCGSPKDMG